MQLEGDAFEEWKDSYFVRIETLGQEVMLRKAFEAGRASRDAEVETLRAALGEQDAEVERLKSYLQTSGSMSRDLWAERDHLRGALRSREAEVRWPDLSGVAVHDEILHDLEEQRDRLRKALREIVEHSYQLDDAVTAVDEKHLVVARALLEEG